jgi:hypothetical protein
MKAILLPLCLTLGFVVPRAYALPLPMPATKPFELVKCTSQKNGTLWMSFGHLLRSGEDQLVYFPTEIALFAKGYTSRQVFLNLDEALKVEVAVGPGRIRLNFTTRKENGTTRREYLTLIQSVRGNPSAFMGNWSATEEGGEAVMDLVACSAD